MDSHCISMHLRLHSSQEGTLCTLIGLEEAGSDPLRKAGTCSNSRWEHMCQLHMARIS